MEWHVPKRNYLRATSIMWIPPNLLLFRTGPVSEEPEQLPPLVTEVAPSGGVLPSELMLEPDVTISEPEPDPWSRIISAPAAPATDLDVTEFISEPSEDLIKATDPQLRCVLSKMTRMAICLTNLEISLRTRTLDIKYWLRSVKELLVKLSKSKNLIQTRCWR